MHRFTSDAPALSREELAEVRARLRRMSDAELRKQYAAALKMCELRNGGQPRAVWIQQLVQAWKELERRSKR